MESEDREFRLRVERVTTYANEAYLTWPITVDERNAATRGMRQPAKEQAETLLFSSDVQNRLREAFMMSERYNSQPERVEAMRDELRSAGLLKSRKAVAK